MRLEDVQVHGAVTAEELAAVLAALREREREDERRTRYERWRRDRIRALRDNS